MLAAEINLDFNQYELGAFGGRQDRTGPVAIEDGGATLRLTGNRWKQIKLPYQVTPNTVLEFDFQSDAEGEIHGIGFDNNLRPSKHTMLQVYGTQNWGRQDFDDYEASQVKHYRIPVGEYFTGNFRYLVFANDHDVRRPTAESEFSNIRIYEDVLPPTAIDDSYTIRQSDGVAILDVLANESDDLDENESISLTSVGVGSEGGTVTVVGDQIAYTPRPGFAGEETFRYTIDNGHPAGQASAVVTVDVLPDEANPVGDIVLQVPGPLELSGERGDHVEVEHTDALALAEGTYVTSFIADDISGYNAIFSKDASGYEDGGHLTAFVRDGRVKVRFQSDSRSVWLDTPKGSIVAGQEYQLAVTFGPDGFWLYLDGYMQDWDLRFDQTMELNPEHLLIGANGWGSTPSKPDWNRDHFTGEISEFTVYSSQLTESELQSLAGVSAPVDPVAPYVVEGVLHGTLDGETLRLADYPGVNAVHGSYGDDLVVAAEAGAILNGGHGQDRLEGGPGDDILYSFGDGREPRIYQEYDASDDPYGEIIAGSRTHFPDQPIEADDVLVGGPGADTFHFRTLVNAKRRIILKHVNDDRTIDWHGVTGENRYVHDHWVERIGNEIIEDFNREEGDHIEIVGHTIDVEKVRHVDLNGDGVIESTVIYLQSNQGNAGAHNKDKLGTITALNAILTKSDYTVNAAPAYGIVETIDELGEALAPRVGTPIIGDVRYDTPTPTPAVAEVTKPDGAVLYVPGSIPFSGERDDYVQIEHTDSLALAEGTYITSFIADDISGYNAIFSKDASGYEDGGHLTAFVRDGRVKVRFQSNSRSVWLDTPKGSIVAGQEYQLAVTFGPDGFWLYLDGYMQDWDLRFDQTMELNPEHLLIGANGWGSTPSKPDWNRDHFTGTISDFTVYGSQLSDAELRTLAGNPAPVDPVAPYVVDGVLYGTLDSETLRLADYPGANAVHGSYGDDLVVAADSGAILNGGHGQDRLEGGPGDDILYSFGDGREPRIYQEYDASDDPYGEIIAGSRTHFPDQPIEADDVLVGGPGADTFHFRTLVNAKRRIILKHVNEDRTIDWHGVTGENRYVHDHWVERIGNEIIEDFNREEGDHIEIVGHTIDVEKVRHVDLNGDGVIESTVIYVQSNQGNAGAHNKDKLGTITALNAILTKSDYTVNAAPAYGIVETIDELDEALAPRVGTPIIGDVRYDTPTPTPAVAEVTKPDGAVLYVPGSIPFSGERDDYVQIEHTDSLTLVEGTYAASFVADDVSGYNAIFSKDASGYEDGGHLTAFVRDGRVKVRFQSDSRSVWLDTPKGSIVAGQEYQLAVTFGPDGFWLYLDGYMQDWDLRFDQTMELNPEHLLIGANGWGSTPSRPDWNRDHFTGTISDFTVYGSQLSDAELRTLAGNPAPVDPVAPFVADGVLHGTLDGETLRLADYPGANAVHGSYGDDVIVAADAGAILNGGHGQDRLEGGPGDDILYSFGDGREPRIYQEYDASDDPYGEIIAGSRTHFPDQPIEADDVLVGGPGADTFHFRTLVNAKRRIILKHVNEDRTIDWHGVTGENRYVHDHWVERIGNEIIEDFNREEGDHIEIVGHTIDVEKVRHVDLNGDGVIESTVIYVQSNQGNAGAHNKEKLGTITALNAILTKSDYTVNAAPAYGIVETIDELDEALAPRVGTPIIGNVRYDTPTPTPAVAEATKPDGAVLYVPDAVPFNAERRDYIEVEHSDALELAEGTYATSFIADDVSGYNAIFSKDASNYEDGGHLTAFVRDGRVKVRFQSDSRSVWLDSESGSIQAGERYHVAVTFGGGGFHLYLNGELVDSDERFTQGMQDNVNSLVIGANTWARRESRLDWRADYFTGVIEGFTVIGSQLDHDAVAELASDGPTEELVQPVFLEMVPFNEKDPTEAVDEVFAEIGMI